MTTRAVGEVCTVCGHPLRARVIEWSLYCSSCGSWESTLPLGHGEVDSDTRIAGFERLRRENFRVVLERLASFRTMQAAELLDVGSAYGWFLEEAQGVGAIASGIEPDERVAARSVGASAWTAEYQHPNRRRSRFPSCPLAGLRKDLWPISTPVAIRTG
jgi:hypothetical protein